MKRTLGMLAATTAAAALCAFGFALTGAAQSDQSPTHAELAQHWAETAIGAQLKGMKTSLRLTADQEKDWGSFESVVKDAEDARFIALQKEQSSDLAPMDRRNAKAERLAQRQAGLEKIVEAAKPLYASLDAAQKQTFIKLGRMLVRERGRFAMEMKRLRVGEGDQHEAAVAAIGGKPAPSAAASTRATTTPGTSGATSALDAALPEANGATSALSAAASTPATTTAGPSEATSAPGAAKPAASGATTEPSGTPSVPSTTTPAAIGMTESAPDAAPEANEAAAEPSGKEPAPTSTTPTAIGMTSAPTGVELKPSGATTEPSGVTAAPAGTASGDGATASGTAKEPKRATTHAYVRRYANHYTYHSRRYGTAYGRNPMAAAVRGVFGGVADLGSLAAYPVYCFPRYDRCHVFVPY